MTEYGKRSRMIDTARIDETKRAKVKRSKRAESVTCPDCLIQRWPVVPWCVGCQLARVVERRRARRSA